LARFLDTIDSLIAIPIFVEAPTTIAEAPASANLGTTGNLLFNIVEAAVPVALAAPIFAATFSTPSSSPLFTISTALSTESFLTW
jgi:hypothetical protein